MAAVEAADDQDPAPEASGAPAQPAPGRHEAALSRAEALRVEGNEQLSKGNFADATKCYQDGLLAVVAVGGEDTKRACDARLALHLNAALAELKRGNLASAIDHSSGALAIDPKSAKALYRRGTARARLAEHTGRDDEAAAALLDLERALELEPGSAEVRSQVKALRNSLRSEKKDLNKSQRTQFKGLFDSGKALYEDEPGEPAPVLRDDGAEGHILALSADKLAFHYERDVQVLTDLSLELREGWCVGLVGNNATGKTTLARLMTGQIRPISGQIRHHGDGCAEPSTRKGRSRVASLVGTLLAALAAVGIAAAGGGNGEGRRALERLLWWHWALLVGAFCLLVLAAEALCSRRGAAGGGGRRRSVLHVSSEASDKEDIKGGKSVEAVISEKMPRHLSKAEKTGYVIALLKAGGFQMYNQETGEPVGCAEEYVRDGLRFGNLSGGQKHLIYILRCFASRPEVLLCDELLGGLDAFRQPRVLRMLNRLKTEGRTAVLYIGCELHQIRLVADSFAYLSGGRVVELGPTMDVLEAPKHPATKEYVGIYRTLPGCGNIGGKLAEAYAGLEGDAALAGPWLPPRG